jgi:hypothetical protein
MSKAFTKKLTGGFPCLQTLFSWIFFIAFLAVSPHEEFKNIATTSYLRKSLSESQKISPKKLESRQVGNTQIKTKQLIRGQPLPLYTIYIRADPLRAYSPTCRPGLSPLSRGEDTRCRCSLRAGVSAMGAPLVMLSHPVWLRGGYRPCEVRRAFFFLLRRPLPLSVVTPSACTGDAH